MQVQPQVMMMLQNSLVKNRVAHAYLFEGKKEREKMILVIFLPKVYYGGPISHYEPCEECSNCKRITSGNHPDVHYVEREGLSIKK